MRNVLTVMTDTDEPLALFDATHPAFQRDATDSEVARRVDEFAREERERKEMTPELLAALGQSTLGKALMQAAGGYLAGMATYRMKLGAEHQGVQAHELDRSIAGSFPAFLAGLRLCDVARFCAAGLARQLEGNPRKPVCLLNLGGGPAADSWNALLLLEQERPGLLAGRAIEIAVLDIDEEGPRFGQRALAALRASGAPLENVDVALRIIRYDWAEPAALAEVLAAILPDGNAAQAALSLSSEGGLFEYGSSEQIAAQLRAFHAVSPADAFVTGSVTREDGLATTVRSQRLVASRPRSLASFEALARDAGWRVEQAIPRPFSYHVFLVKA